jgi:anti-sigma factor RsiW
MTATDLTCREFVEIVTDYLEQILPTSERLRCEQHLVVCSACARYVDQTRTTIRLAGTLAVDELGNEGHATLLAAIQERRQ